MPAHFWPSLAKIHVTGTKTGWRGHVFMHQHYLPGGSALQCAKILMSWILVEKVVTWFALFVLLKCWCLLANNCLVGDGWQTIPVHIFLYLLSLVLTFLSVVSAWNSAAASEFAFVSCSHHNSLYDCQNQPSLTVHVTMLHDQNSFAASWIYCLWQEHQSIIKCLLLCLIFAKFICRVAPGARYRICSIRFLARWHKSQTEPGLVVWDFCIVYYFC